MILQKVIKIENTWLVTIVFNHGFKFQDFVCDGCHDLTKLSVNISDIAIITVKNIDYCCNIHNISKSEAINILKSSILFYLFLVYIKWLIL